MSLKNKKAAGLDGVFPEFFKECLHLLLPFLEKFFNRLFTSGQFPDDWTKSILLPIHKKGDREDCGNYRGIVLIDSFSKIFAKIINRRLGFFVSIYNRISEAQAGFREDHSTADNAFILRAVIEKYLSRKGLKLYTAFVDLRKAFDSVNRNKLWFVMKQAGIKGKLLQIVRNMYDSVKICVRNDREVSDFFVSRNGLKQGCVLSPLLFCLFIEELHTAIIDSGTTGIQLSPDIIEIFILMFADDIAMLADSVVGLQRLFNILHRHCLRWELSVNLNKTNVVVFRNGGPLSKHEKWTFGGEQVETANDYTYVGLLFSSQISINKMTEILAAKGKRVFIAVLNSLYDLGTLPTSVFFKIHVFDAKVLQILLYGCKIWGMDKFDDVERVQLYACKRFMCVGNNA